MATKAKYAIEISVFWPAADRYVPRGYRKSMEMGEIMDAITEIGDVDGVELYWPGDFDDPVRMKDILKERELGVSAVGIDIFGDAKWQNGALTSADSKIRAEAIQRAKEGMDAAAILGTNLITLWPGQDGYDYCWQANYEVLWGRLVEALSEIGEYRKDIKVGLEYKIKEPRIHLLVATVGKALVLVDSLNLKNVGVAVDLGHALMAQENPAESICLLNKCNRLFHIHINDNFRYWDDDLVPGSVHLWEILEALYWINKINYEGWFNFDIYPYREDPIRACKQSIRNTKKLMKIAQSIDGAKINQLQNKVDAISIIELLWGKVLR